MPLYDGTRKIPKFWNEIEIDRILSQVWRSKDYLNNEWGDWMKHRDFALISTIYIMGLRPKEGCCLRFDDFDLIRGYLHINGKNNKNKKDRNLPIPRALIKVLKVYLTSFPRARFWKGSKYLFPSFSNQHISPARLKHIFREKVLKPLGMWLPPTTSKVPPYRLYTLRHSRGSNLRKKQQRKHGIADMISIADFMGHGDLRSTKIYMHGDEDYMEYLREQIEI